MAVTHKPYKGLPMEGIIATWYARNTANDVRGTRKCASSIADRLKSGARVLEVAPGPGDLAIEIARLGDYDVAGMHLSALNAKLTKWPFREMLLKSAYTREDIDAMVSQSRFAKGEISQDGIGFELRLAK